ncbi:MAG: transposase, partial [Chloroflexi bacterium]|nr:transposase [Chloroflexota bacterium]
MSIPSLLAPFRQRVYQKFRKRADAALDLVDAVTTAGVVASPVAMSEEPPFRRKFSMVYDVLEDGEVDVTALGKVLYEAQPADCATLAGYEVYAVDATPNPRPAAETLPNRVLLKSDKDSPAVPGWKFSWLVRLVQHGTSWVAPQAIEQIPADSTANQVAGAQVVALDKQSTQPKVAVLDSGYFNHFFLALCVALKTVIVLVRMRHNCALYERPEPKPAKSKGAPRKHGAKFKLNKPTRTPDRTATLALGPLTVVLTAWHGLHLKKVATLVGLALRVEFQKADGTPRYQRPLWLFWTGPLTVALGDICLMYLWRFAIEHAFRFM